MLAAGCEVFGHFWTPSIHPIHPSIHVHVHHISLQHAAWPLLDRRRMYRMVPPYPIKSAPCVLCLCTLSTLCTFLYYTYLHLDSCLPRLKNPTIGNHWNTSGLGGPVARHLSGIVSGYRTERPANGVSRCEPLANPLPNGGKLTSYLPLPLPKQPNPLPLSQFSLLGPHPSPAQH